MLNKEKYAKEIFDIACSGSPISVVEGIPAACYETNCPKCEFSNKDRNCHNIMKNWANSEYVEPTVDWGNVAVDTPIYVRDSDKEEWKRRYFAEYESHHIYAYSYGATSWSSCGNTTIWKYAKLAEDVKE